MSAYSNGVAQTVPRLPLPNVILLASLLQRLPQPDPRPRLPVRVASRTAEPVKAARVVKGMGRARLYSLDRLCYTWATAREAAFIHGQMIREQENGLRGYESYCKQLQTSKDLRVFRTDNLKRLFDT